MEPDFSGWATKANLKCSDGRTIMPDAFKHQDKMKVPLVWHHRIDDSKNILGHAILEAKDDGVYTYGFFNDTESGKNAKLLVQHDDIKFLSIYANGLVEKKVSGTKQVLHGAIKEISLVVAGANPGAEIDYVRIAHSDDPEDVEILETEAIITTGLELKHGDDAGKPEEKLQHADTGDDMTLKEVYDSLTPIQKEVVQYMISVAAESNGGSASHSDLPDDAKPQEIYDALSDQQKSLVHGMIEDAVEEAKETAKAEHSALVNNQEGNAMTHNVFEQGASASHSNAGRNVPRRYVSKEQVAEILANAQKMGSLKEAILAHADSYLEHADPVAGEDYGVKDIDVLFPDARLDGNGITLVSRRMDWVNNVLTNTTHTPFSRVKSLSADLTADEARAKGYVKGTMKRDEVIKLLKRVTTPKTIYKKQKLDRDDILDITELDFVAWLKGEMRIMLDEEIARAILVSDNRPADDPDKIDEDHVRPVAYDVDMYNTTINIPADLVIATTPAKFVDFVASSMSKYKGSGSPTFYTTLAIKTQLLLSRDGVGRREYQTVADLAAAMGVKDVVDVEVMEQDSDLVGVLVNLRDYTVGADQGGAVSMFDDFDIDFNQEKYLLETRISGALTRPKSAITFKKDSGHIVTPTMPTFNSSTGVVTIPTVTGVVYTNADTGTTLTAGAQSAIAAGATSNVAAVPAAGYGFTHDADDEWSFTRDA